MKLRVGDICEYSRRAGGTYRVLIKGFTGGLVILEKTGCLHCPPIRVRPRRISKVLNQVGTGKAKP